MFDRSATRSWLAIGWVVIFAIMWLLLSFLLPGKTMAGQLDRLENTIVQENWAEASIEMDRFDRTWKQNRLFVQMANGSEEINLFEQTIGEVKTLVKLKDTDALDLIGGLRVMTQDATTVFPGP